MKNQEQRSGAREIVAEGKYLRFVKVDGYEAIERCKGTGVVAICALTDADEIILVEQYRIPVSRRVVELPAGLVNDDAAPDLKDAEETIYEAAARELIEETGFKAEKLELLDHWAVSAGMTSETASILKATGLKKVGDGGGDSTESITVHVVPLKQLNKWLQEKQKQGCLIDAKIYGGVYLATRT